MLNSLIYLIRANRRHRTEHLLLSQMPLRQQQSYFQAWLQIDGGDELTVDSVSDRSHRVVVQIAVTAKSPGIKCSWECMPASKRCPSPEGTLLQPQLQHSPKSYLCHLALSCNTEACLLILKSS